MSNSFTAKVAKDAKEEKSLTAKGAEDAKENNSLTAKVAKDAEGITQMVFRRAGSPEGRACVAGEGPKRYSASRNEDGVSDRALRILGSPITQHPSSITVSS